MTFDNKKYPLAIGGLGGSGTRLITDIIHHLGYVTGTDLNESNDTLLFTLLFKRYEIIESSETQFDELVQILIKGIRGHENLNKSEKNIVLQLAKKSRTQHDSKWLRLRAKKLINNCKTHKEHQLWGWKEPNTHIVLPRLYNSIPNLKYIHVIRNGLDMAFSTNQNQLQLWGPHLLKEQFELSPKASLRYWVEMHKNLLKNSSRTTDQFFMLDYDQFCLNPHHGIEKLLSFLDIKITAHQMEDLLALIKPPTSIGRFRRYDIKQFDKTDLEYVQELGFVIE
ncbi:MAG: sulfotransferase [Akkermansiaceae bacterium]